MDNFNETGIFCLRASSPYPFFEGLNQSSLSGQHQLHWLVHNGYVVPAVCSFVSPT
jgi:hypothetical protein